MGCVNGLTRLYVLGSEVLPTLILYTNLRLVKIYIQVRFYELITDLTTPIVHMLMIISQGFRIPWSRSNYSSGI
jgi:hypothetical protein